MKKLLLLSFIVVLGLGNAHAQEETIVSDNNTYVENTESVEESTSATEKLLAVDSVIANINVCDATLREHIDLVQSTDTYFLQVNDHASEVSSYEITQIQKKLTQRFLSLKHLFNVYDDVVLNCKNKIMPTAAAIYDFTQVGKTIFGSKSLRRVVKGLVKFEDYKLTDYIAYYDRYTNKKLINHIQEKLEASTDINENDKTMISKADGAPSVKALSDISVRGTTAIVAGAARIWGFISDHLAWREGRLKDNAEAKSLLETNLRPLDLIYEKRTFLLSNYTIPGHWGHVGIWLGTKEELIEMGVWDKDYFAPFREFVEAGRSIIEIRKEGINYQSLDTFINLDEVAVTRVRNIADHAEEVFAELAVQLNKKYDFKFDARTADKITCAELIAFSYGDVRWHETKTLFQISLRPDDMALSTLDEEPASDFILYLKGNKDKKTFQNLDFDEWTKVFKLKK